MAFASFLITSPYRKLYEYMFSRYFIVARLQFPRVYAHTRFAVKVNRYILCCVFPKKGQVLLFYAGGMKIGVEIAQQ